MAKRTITHLYDSYDDARQILADLEAAGFPNSDISVVGRDGEGESMAGTGAGVGAVVGGGAGLLAGLGTIAIPGIGPVVAAGWLVATLAGAVVGGGAGGIVGSLVHAGVDEDEAHVYAEGVRRGGSLLTVRVDENRAAEAERIMNGRNYADWRERNQEYRRTGWSRFDEAGTPYIPPAIPPGDRVIR
jgi:hypothetical protein